MDLAIFFQPLSEQAFEHIKASDTVRFYIDIHSSAFPDWQAADIALIGVPEARGSGLNGGTSHAPAAIRQALYALKKGSGPYHIADLGDLRPGASLQDTYERLREVCEMLLTFQVLPLIIGGSHDLLLPQYWAYESAAADITVLSVDAFADMESPFSAPLSENYLHTLLLHEPNYLFEYILLGYQSYLVNTEAIAVLERMEQSTFRLGQLRDDFRQVEPLIRQADMLAFDVAAIKKQDAPGNARAQPFGLTGEEACRLCWYAGLSDKLSSFGLYEYNPEWDTGGHTAQVLATMLWYVIEGFYERPPRPNPLGPHTLRYVVPLEVEGSLTFFKDQLSSKWWIEVPGPQSFLLPCTYQDYLAATSGHLPYRWVKALSKLG